jgi:sec-independent protein translocase protein TatB
MLLMFFVLVVFGPKRLPEISRQVGKALREVRKVTGEVKREMRAGLAIDQMAPGTQQKALIPYAPPTLEEATPASGNGHTVEEHKAE